MRYRVLKSIYEDPLGPKYYLVRLEWDEHTCKTIRTVLKTSYDLAEIQTLYKMVNGHTDFYVMPNLLTTSDDSDLLL